MYNGRATTRQWSMVKELVSTADYYRMTISRNTIDKLGVKLYDKVSAVVAELVANAYDADAEKVKIELPLGQYLANKKDGGIVDKGFEIKVSDDGDGMTPEELNKFYLPIGKDRRVDDDRGSTSRRKHRHVMGRKGIGKLAPFGVCKTIEVMSSGGTANKHGFLSGHLFLNFDDIVQDTDAPYSPPSGNCDNTYAKSSGTTITLKNFLFRRIPDAETFNRQLSARFGLTRSDWAITVVNSLDPSKTFEIGELDVALLDGTKIDLSNQPVIMEDGTKLAVTGWVGISNEAYKDEIMAGIRVYVRGKIAVQTRDFDIPSGFTGEHTIRSYLVGEIHADWLDDENDDLIRSDRQGILWTSERGQAFQAWGQSIIRDLGNKSLTSRRQQIWQIFLERSNIEEVAKARFPDSELRRSVIEVAQIVARTASRESLDDTEYVQSLVDLAFSIGPHRAIVDKLREISSDSSSPFETLVGLFTQARLAEMYSLGQIAAERIKAIDNLETKLTTAENETELQKLLEGAPWLIDPHWTVLTQNQALKTTRAALERWYSTKYGTPLITSAIDNPDKRPDFVLLNFNQALQVVEIKKPGHEFDDEDFLRLHNYYEALSAFLSENPELNAEFPSNFHITLVCDTVELDGVNLTAYERLKSELLTQISWEEFLARTKKMHQQFLLVSESQT